MPQKPLKANKKIEKKKEAANRHGKTSVTRKGKFEKPPKKGRSLELFKDDKELSKAINKRNESTAAGIAEQSGGKLKVIKGPPPVMAPKNKQKKAGAKVEEAMEE
ncbi:hypothetical protein VOLCADRAFT_102864 [Volvox carteri f. nagariensis]|uniref:Uncharacterized protein n=1 Tax=Volvox carteri f. nagariensis TaxID=3068 RepID=D8TIL3_VOLCA|nr:uncharacterized protein VOLCADRAFT_102864 [Volvox carteri f. nagariensis]EFJ52907.1 hypothetical protein VOLCADRAFT_102864 [Volvox carteri f. nagariensis]|eukprot:XP_002945912.1 hypothetical protein VOLCADRAFT_102864 [Volvox carteri f. nagariensis]